MKPVYTLKYMVKKVKCGQCGTKIIDGQQAVVVTNENEKIKAYLCSDTCMKTHKEATTSVKEVDHYD